MRGPALWIAIVLAVLCAFVYSSVPGFAFVTFDDPQYITENPNIVHGLTGEALAWAFTSSNGYYWHPVTWISHMLDISLFGLDPGPMHTVNLLLHIATTVLLFFVLNSWTGALWRSAFATALFAVHPLRVESVAWISERKDVLSGLFFVLLLWTYKRYTLHRSPLHYATVLLTLAAGLMAKPMLVTAPLVLLLLDFWPLQRGFLTKALVVEKLPLLALSVLSGILTFTAQRSSGAVVGVEQLSLSLRFSNGLASYFSYLAHTFWPADLAPLYPFLPPPAWQVTAALALLLAVTAFTWTLRRTAPYALVGWLWFVGMLFPVAGFVQAGVQASADRFTYLPSIGLMIALVWGLAGLKLPARPLAYAATAVVLILTLAARLQASYWDNSVTLWTRTLAVTEFNYLAHNNLGTVLRTQNRLPEAIEHFTAALRIRPDFPEGHANLGAVLAQSGRVEEAIPHYLEALRANPNQPDAHNNLGVAYANLGRPADAIAQFEQSLQAKPDQPDVHSNLGVMLEEAGRIPEAIQHFEAALRLNPQQGEARRSLDRLRPPH